MSHLAPENEPYPTPQDATSPWARPQNGSTTPAPNGTPLPEYIAPPRPAGPVPSATAQGYPAPQSSPGPTYPVQHGDIAHPVSPVQPMAHHRTASRTLGRIALFLALLALAMSVVMSVMAGQAMGAVFADAGFATMQQGPTVEHLQAANPERMEDFNRLSLWQGVPTIAGLTALVCAIIALVKQRSKAAGVLAIIVAVLAPVISYVVCVVVALISSGLI